jgi:hypothetical protein
MKHDAPLVVGSILGQAALLAVACRYVPLAIAGIGRNGWRFRVLVVVMEPWAFDSPAMWRILLLVASGDFPAFPLPVARTDDDPAITRMIQDLIDNGNSRH